MKNNKKNIEKDFDAVKFMSEVRDKISKEIADMTPEQIKEYFDVKKLNERIIPRAYQHKSIQLRVQKAEQDTG